MVGDRDTDKIPHIPHALPTFRRVDSQAGKVERWEGSVIK